jgi:acetylornithine/succinyldiaminopimelate/putrescine aminotransferase
VNDKTVAVMIELIQGEGGINIATPEFVKGLRELCDQRNLLLIVDEVQTGIGRTGTMFAWQQYGIEPDIFTLAKSLGGGLPIGVMMAKTEIADLLSPGTHASTFGGGPVVCRAALAVLKAVQKEKMLANTKAMGQYLREQLSELKNKYPVIKDVRGMGLMCGAELSIACKPIVEACMQKGLLINCTHDKVLRIMPALNVTKSQISKAIEILDTALAADHTNA